MHISCTFVITTCISIPVAKGSVGLSHPTRMLRLLRRQAAWTHANKTAQTDLCTDQHGRPKCHTFASVSYIQRVCRFFQTFKSNKPNGDLQQFQRHSESLSIIDNYLMFVDHVIVLASLGPTTFGKAIGWSSIWTIPFTAAD